MTRAEPSHGTSSSEVGDAELQDGSREVRRVAVSGFLGNMIEIYDFVLYGSAAALVLGPLFFGNLSPALATIASFSTLATGFIARPIGGMVFGYLGDRVGRKAVLISTLTLMGVASGLIGMLPTRSAIGVAAPILLIVLRLLQGIAAGGEWGGSVLMIAEHSDGRRRGFYSALGQAGMPAGSILASLALAAVTLLPRDQLLSWGWRIPFLASFVLLAISLYVRSRISESPLFVESGPAARGGRAILGTLFGSNLGALLRAFAISIPIPLAGTVFGSFTIAYATTKGHSQPSVLLAFTIGLAVSIVLMPFSGALTDRIGRRPVFIAAAVTFAIVAYPFFLVIGLGSTPLMYVAFIVVISVVAVGMQGALAQFLSELFPLRTRSLGVSIAYQCSGVVAGLAPLVGASLLAVAGAAMGIVWVALITAVLGLLAALAAWRSSESNGVSLAASGAESPALASP
ncbi:MAG: MFS transporter [Pseudonocardia sp.]|uniref:MFS transporter n=1 Tax=unclassified Pseudonocardia TaxID=2619320 RepID=UPI00086A5420|nr:MULTISPECIES: MFS transporter [unclassified Pseudonocardia]MBN9110203.1 MFS transporter [Pseudonocardia sp.]ODU26295.1 MAG: hypothetical protein ABS80_07550 [Pseudonocardia sp. SCN 72-51]ODV07308.1 MAG: hypothetical protein ABT15_09705 [Pseudonocardia sp. SCN 73-27]